MGKKNSIIREMELSVLVDNNTIIAQCYIGESALSFWISFKI